MALFLHVLFLWFFAVLSVTVESQSQEWSINLSNDNTTSFYYYWDKCVGSGHASLLLRSDWREYMENGKNKINFSYVRAHGILDDDIGSVNGINDYSFINIDKIYEYLLSISMKPYIEISFMPQKFASNASETVCHYKGGTSPPFSFDIWYDFIAQWLQHLVDHFGIDEVNLWRFEVWNEPNIGSWEGNPKYETYLALYNATATAIKSVSESLMVGGPTSCCEVWLDQFLNDVLSQNIPIDFVVTHSYPNQNNGQKIDRIDTYFTVLQNALDIVAKYNAKHKRQLPFLISEYNSGCCITPFGDFWNDDNYYSASFLFFWAKYLQPLFSADEETRFLWMSYWAISDVFEESGFNSNEFSNLYGLQTIRGIPKPAFRALQLLAEFGSDVEYASVLKHSDDYNATNSTVQVYCLRNGNSGNSNRVSVFVANWNNYGIGQIRNESVQIEIVNNLNLNVSENGIGMDVKSITLYRIDEKHTTPLSTWLEMGKPKYPTADQMQKLNESSQLRAITAVNYTKINGNTIRINVDMLPYSAAVLDLQYYY